MNLTDGSFPWLAVAIVIALWAVGYIGFLLGKEVGEREEFDRIMQVTTDFIESEKRNGNPNR